jgi:hypothetical protein
VSVGRTAILAITCVIFCVACLGKGANSWPGDAGIQTVDGMHAFGGNLSGLTYEGSDHVGARGVLWAVRNSPGSLLRLVWNGTVWTPDATSSWHTGKALRYPDGTGNPDAEGVTFAERGSAGGIYVATEQDNDTRVIRNSVLRFDVNAVGMTLTATDEWNLSDLSGVEPNRGIEGITWISDSYLVATGLFDERSGRVYDPRTYPEHGTGLFFVGVETNGMIAGYALRSGGAFNRIVTVTSGLPSVMDLHFDRETHDLWAICDVRCNGQAVVLRIDPLARRFVVAGRFDRPRSLPNVDNEGFALAPLSECAADRRPVFWADDSETGGHAIRRGMVSCAPVP